MFGLRAVILLMTHAVLVGVLLVTVLVLGWVGWVPIAGAISLGLLLSWPATHLVMRWIREQDPSWKERRDRPR
jgi:hypothetical protein